MWWWGIYWGPKWGNIETKKWWNETAAINIIYYDLCCPHAVPAPFDPHGHIHSGCGARNTHLTAHVSIIHTSIKMTRVHRARPQAGQRGWMNNWICVENLFNRMLSIPECEQSWAMRYPRLSHGMSCRIRFGISCVVNLTRELYEAHEMGMMTNKEWNKIRNGKRMVSWNFRTSHFGWNYHYSFWCKRTFRQLHAH